MTEKFKFEFGKYYIGDLSCLLHRDWNQVKEVSYKNNKFIEGSFTIQSQSSVFSFYIAQLPYETGTLYEQTTGNTICHETGSIGLLNIINNNSYLTQHEDITCYNEQIFYFKYNFNLDISIDPIDNMLSVKIGYLLYRPFPPKNLNWISNV